MEKTPADIIILYKCTKNHDHILYYSWDIVRDGCNCYFSFWAIFALLHAPPPSAPPVTAWKIKIKKKKKNRKKKQQLEVSFSQVYQKSWWHAVLFLRYGAWHMSLFLILGYFLPFYPLKFPKNQKNSWRYQHFTHVYQRWWLDDVWFLGYGIQQTDAWTDGQKKWHIEVAAPPKKISISNRVQLSLGSKKKRQL